MKPANLLVTPDGHVKVLDLGLAGSTIEGESVRLGRVVGTIDYMAPEQIRSPDTVGPSGDIYALGCTAYYALTAEVPFPGGTRQEKAQRQLKEHPRPLRQLRPDLGEGLCQVVEAMMQKDPRDRPASAEAVVERLRPWAPPSPLAMPRVKSEPPSTARVLVGATPPAQPDFQFLKPTAPEDVSTDKAPGISTIWSVLEEADRDGEPTPGGRWFAWRMPSVTAWIWGLVRPASLAAAVSLGFVAVLALISRIEPEAAGRLFGPLGLALVGLGTFTVLLAIQVIVAALRDGP
jgi:serine/threonine protein kinase